jgi:GNAT superfamily N-acetyltransferase
MQTLIRPATTADANAVTHVLVESRLAFLPFATMAHTPEEIRAWIATDLIPNAAVWVAEADQKVVAMLAISAGTTHRWVDQLYVLPGFERRGMGSQLLRFAHTQLAPPIRLFTFQANTRARQFYEVHGYRAIAFTDGADNEERCPDVLYEFLAS